MPPAQRRGRSAGAVRRTHADTCREPVFEHRSAAGIDDVGSPTVDIDIGGVDIGIGIGSAVGLVVADGDRRPAEQLAGPDGDGRRACDDCRASAADCGSDTDRTARRRGSDVPAVGQRHGVGV